MLSWHVDFKEQLRIVRSTPSNLKTISNLAKLSRICTFLLRIIKDISGKTSTIYERIYILFVRFFAYCISHIKISIYKVAVALDCNYVGRVPWAYTFRNKINASSRLPMCRLVRYILFWSKYNHMHLRFVLYVTTVLVVSPQNIFYI